MGARGHVTRETSMTEEIAHANFFRVKVDYLPVRGVGGNITRRAYSVFHVLSNGGSRVTLRCVVRVSLHVTVRVLIVVCMAWPRHRSQGRKFALGPDKYFAQIQDIRDL